MIKILYALNGLFEKGGTETVVLNYFDNIDKTRFSIDFLLHGHEDDDDGSVTDRLRSAGSNVFYVTPRGEDYFKNKKEISAVLENGKYDIVHSHMDAAGGFLLAQAEKSGVGVRVSHSHNTAHQIDKGSFLKNLLYQCVLDYAIAMLNRHVNVRIACSQDAGVWLYKKNTFIVINNGIDAENFVFSPTAREKVRALYGIGEETVVGHVGRFSKQKNHHFILEIFKKILALSPDAKLMLLGEGELRGEITNEVRQMGIDKNVIFTGNVENTGEYYSAMDVFILPSLHEGLPVCSVEAQANGLTCVFSDTVSRQADLNKKSRFIPLTEDSGIWASAVMRAVQTSRVEGYETVVSCGYDIKTIVKTLEKIYTDALQ